MKITGVETLGNKLKGLLDLLIHRTQSNKHDTVAPEPAERPCRCCAEPTAFIMTHDEKGQRLDQPFCSFQCFRQWNTSSPMEAPATALNAGRLNCREDSCPTGSAVGRFVVSSSRQE